MGFGLSKKFYYWVNFILVFSRGFFCGLILNLLFSRKLIYWVNVNLGVFWEGGFKVVFY